MVAGSVENQMKMQADVREEKVTANVTSSFYD